MAYLIDENYFKRELFVPNADEQDRRAYAELQEFIDDKARLCLKDALGYTLFKDLDSNITNGNLNEDAPQKWLNLVNGAEYTKDNVLLKWDGLLVKEGAFRKSLLANFTYYHWLQFNQTTMSGVGEVVLSAKNAVSVNSTERQIGIWNEFVNMYQGENTKFYHQTYYKRGVKVIDWCGNDTSNDFVNLVKFLNDNKEDYPDVNPKLYDFKNQLGL